MKKEGKSFLSSLGKIQPGGSRAPSPKPPPPPPRLERPPEEAAVPAPRGGDGGIQAKLARLEEAVKAMQAELQEVKAVVDAPEQDARTKKELESINKKLENLGGAVKELDNSEIKDTLAACALKISELESGLQYKDKALPALKKEVEVILAEYRENLQTLKNGLGDLKNDSKYLDSSLEKLQEKASGLENVFGPGLEELREKITSHEKLEKRMFLEFESELEKVFQEKFGNMLAQLKAVREKIDAVSQDYRLVIDKKMLVLETKYSAFETLSRRLDSIEKDLKK